MRWYRNRRSPGTGSRGRGCLALIGACVAVTPLLYPSAGSIVPRGRGPVQIATKIPRLNYLIRYLIFPWKLSPPRQVTFTGRHLEVPEYRTVLNTSLRNCPLQERHIYQSDRMSRRTILSGHGEICSSFRLTTSTLSAPAAFAVLVTRQGKSYAISQWLSLSESMGFTAAGRHS